MKIDRWMQNYTDNNEEDRKQVGNVSAECRRLEQPSTETQIDRWRQNSTDKNEQHGKQVESVSAGQVQLDDKNNL
ncbi:hypothetical protein Ddc_15216 [Ditylenchus destructor]|nr:hypothetical protein Ddc_15216 [Ditylenchus destructor]